MTQTLATASVSDEKKSDLVSVCADEEQTHWVNRLQCVCPLFLCCITATPQPEERTPLVCAAL